MACADRWFVLLAFLLVGIVVGYFIFLIFRIAVHQQKFDWSGALSAITSLAGGGFLSYQSRPGNFAAYGIGFFIGFAAYWLSMQTQGHPSHGFSTGSRAASSREPGTEFATRTKSDIRSEPKARQEAASSLGL
jgi:hypothetical protein